jgi:acetyl-CoA acyltransferase
MQTTDTFILSSVRTAVAKARRGAFNNVRPEHYGSTAVMGALERAGVSDGSMVDDVVIGCAFPEGPQGMNMARAIALRSGLPEEVSGVTVNRFCSSGLQTIAQATNSIAAGQADLIVAGGVESMSLVPMGGYYFSPDPDVDPDFYVSMGITAENVAEQFNVSREDQDEFAYRSHQKAIDAMENGRFKNEIVPVEVTIEEYDAEKRETSSRTFTHDTDEGPRADTSIEALAKLKPAFKKGGTVTAGNASQMNDAAAATVVASRRVVDELGAEPIARLLGFAVAGVAPDIMGIGPVRAIPKVLKQVGLDLKDIGLFEINEAFASQSLAIIRELGIDQDIVNVNGGAISMGHPLGCTGAKLTATILHEMERRGIRYGIVSMCVGGGMGAAGVLENLRV